jgi:hypothetical protein
VGDRAADRGDQAGCRCWRGAGGTHSAAYILDTHPGVEAFVKNAGLGFAIPYLHNGQPHDYVPDFIVRLKTEPMTHLILETKGFDELAEVKAAAAERWVAAVNADARYGTWRSWPAGWPTCARCWSADWEWLRLPARGVCGLVAAGGRLVWPGALGASRLDLPARERRQ